MISCRVGKGVNYRNARVIQYMKYFINLKCQIDMKIIFNALFLPFYSSVKLACERRPKYADYNRLRSLYTCIIGNARMRLLLKFCLERLL